MSTEETTEQTTISEPAPDAVPGNGEPAAAAEAAAPSAAESAASPADAPAKPAAKPRARSAAASAPAAEAPAAETFVGEAPAADAPVQTAPTAEAPPAETPPATAGETAPAAGVASPEGAPAEAQPADARPPQGEQGARPGQDGGRRDQQGGGKGKNKNRRDRDRNKQREERREGPVIACTGILDVLPDGFGFLRTNGFTQGERDVYVSLSQIRRVGLRRGDQILGQVREPKDNEKYNALLKIDEVNGIDPETARKRPVFEQLTPLFPDERLRLETEEHDTAARIMDLMCPIGKGQRGLIVRRPRPARPRSSRSWPTPSPTTIPRPTSSCCSSTSARRRSPTCSAR